MAPARTDHSAAIHSADGPHKDPDAQGGGKLGGGARREDLVVKGAKGQGIESIFLAFPPPSHCPPAASCTSHSPRVSERLWLFFALKASAPWLWSHFLGTFSSAHCSVLEKWTGLEGGQCYQSFISMLLSLETSALWPGFCAQFGYAVITDLQWEIHIWSLSGFWHRTSQIICCPVTKSCATLCDPMNCSMPGFPVLHYLPGLAKTHVHWVGDSIQTSYPLLLSSLPALNLSQHQGLFPWVGSLHQVAEVLELQLQHQSFQWIPRTDFL